MRNLLSAIVAATLLGTFGCESCWEQRDPPKETASAPTPPSAEPAPPAPAAQPAAPTAPPPAMAATEPKSPEELAKERALEERHNNTGNPLRRFEPKQIKLGGQRVMAKPTVKFRPLREHASPAGDTQPAPAPAASTAPTPQQ